MTQVVFDDAAKRAEPTAAGAARPSWASARPRVSPIVVYLCSDRAAHLRSRADHVERLSWPWSMAAPGGARSAVGLDRERARGARRRGQRCTLRPKRALGCRVRCRRPTSSSMRCLSGALAEQHPARHPPTDPVVGWHKRHIPARPRPRRATPPPLVRAADRERAALAAQRMDAVAHPLGLDRCRSPSTGYPWSWKRVKWLAGVRAAVESPA